MGRRCLRASRRACIVVGEDQGLGRGQAVVAMNKCCGGVRPMPWAPNSRALRRRRGGRRWAGGEGLISSASRKELNSSESLGSTMGRCRDDVACADVDGDEVAFFDGEAADGEFARVMSTLRHRIRRRRVCPCAGDDGGVASHAARLVRMPWGRQAMDFVGWFRC
jgi:hypothetical protein